MKTNQHGFALITVVFAMAVLLIIVSASYSLAKTQISTSKNGERSVEALAQAEAGVDYAVARIRAGEISETSITFALSDISTTVQVTQSTTTVTILSTCAIPAGGDYPQASRALLVVFSKRSDPGGATMQIPAYWARPLAADGTIHWNGNNAWLDGSGLTGPAIQSNASSKPSVTFNGNHLTVIGAEPDIGYIEGSGATLPGGTAATKGVVPPYSILTMDTTYWAALAKPPSSVPIAPTYFNSQTTLTGPAWVNGNLIINTNNAIVYGPLYVNGNITISANNVYMNGVIFAKGDITISSNNLREPSGSQVGVTFVAAKKADGSGGNVTQSANNVVLNGLDGFGIIAEANVSISTNNFNQNGLIYAGGNVDLPSNNFDLKGALAVKGNVTINDNVFRVTWKDFSGSASGSAPPGLIGAGASPGDFSMLSWLEVAP